MSIFGTLTQNFNKIISASDDMNHSSMNSDVDLSQLPPSTAGVLVAVNHVVVDVVIIVSLLFIVVDVTTTHPVISLLLLPPH